MKVINLFAGPGAGKSTTAADLFTRMKWSGWNVELVTEFAKDLTWEERHLLLNEGQPYILGKQYWRLKRLKGKVDVAITDSPLLLSWYYNQGRMPALDDLALALHNEFDNFNVLLQRNPSRQYVHIGRTQNEGEALAVDRAIAALMEIRKIPVSTFMTSPSAGHQILLEFATR